MPRGWIQRLWLGGTLTLISWISFSCQIGIIWPWYGSVLSLDLLKLLVPFNLLVFMVFWNYRLCVTTPPGEVPRGWRPSLSNMEGVEVKKNSHAPRYCKMCNHYKPPRTHHCRQCKTCVLKLDHHCPWIVNCVGYYNQGHFIRFLVYVDLATSYHLAMLVRRVMDMTPRYAAEPTLFDILFLVFNFATCVPVWLCVGMFSMYHLYLVSGNSTTIEGWEKDKVATLVRRGKIREIKYPYNIGFIANMNSVLGSNPLLWLWPQAMKGDGLSFPVNPEAGDSDAQYQWPPQDPTRLPNPPPRSGQSAFTYGGESFNPALKPSSSSSSALEQIGIGELRNRRFSSTLSEGSEGSEASGSSPEHYLSDYDYDESLENGDKAVEEARRMQQPYPSDNNVRVRRGSEGYEVSSGAAAWNMDLEHQVAAHSAWDQPRGPVWLEQGRYNVYEPHAVDDDDDYDSDD
ncbi:DHHC palmitoyltransferase-domain-containing protein [Kockovaella imperatae]|uniref:Palmitoyltransferase PFA4 n=1 Tax=Kockovaella imperatae TaxID=4999 RepID=A0A1Y1U6X1_9TREE|nr:DHHC palmitoyltransferase-domain-containing protein [Kockovaella imperatae]ORX33793.1 DHHC palmitoyltransferase-domain-containing protein [Kockovaella imperatae]